MYRSYLGRVGTRSIVDILTSSSSSPSSSSLADSKNSTTRGAKYSANADADAMDSLRKQVCRNKGWLWKFPWHSLVESRVLVGIDLESRLWVSTMNSWINCS